MRIIMLLTGVVFSIASTSGNTSSNVHSYNPRNTQTQQRQEPSFTPILSTGDFCEVCLVNREQALQLLNTSSSKAVEYDMFKVKLRSHIRDRMYSMNENDPYTALKIVSAALNRPVLNTVNNNYYSLVNEMIDGIEYGSVPINRCHRVIQREALELRKTKLIIVDFTSLVDKIKVNVTVTRNLCGVCSQRKISDFE